ncbi:MAG: tRNA (guanosine(46)-N7)-methyltransferase TrmB [Gammaproteobacteria bacterium]|nr:tRNA (guanosine(46)-N7)-methyltransferase TrmB [Gammaproteobacteria bacterium]
MTTRTYLRRRGRISKGQARALTEHSGQFLISAQPGSRVAVDWSSVFGRRACLGLEIGFGMGHALVDWGQQHPDWNLLGIDVYQPGIGSVLLGLRAQNLDHVRIIDAEAHSALSELFSPASLDEVRIYFPDPWPKKRHQKRRLIQPGFATLLADRMKPGGMLLLASDWQPYAEWMLNVLDREAGLENLAGTGRFTEGNSDRPTTNFEARGRSLGHAVWNLAYKRC